MSTDWTQVKERGNYWAIRTMAELYKYGGRWVIIPVLYAVVFYFYATKPDSRRCSARYLARIKKLSPARQINQLNSWQHHMSFGRALLDRVSAWMGQASVEQVDFDNRQELLDAKKAEGAIILTAHFGNLEMARGLVSDGKRIALNIVVDTLRTESFNRLLQQLNPESKINLISTHALGPSTAIDIQERLKKGESLIIMADRVSAGAQKRVIPAKLLGDDIQLPEGSFRLALSLGSPIFFMCCTKQPKGRFNVHLKRLHTSELKGTKKQKTTALAMSYIKELEGLCLQYPLQWFNFYDYWREGADATQEHHQQ